MVTHFMTNFVISSSLSSLSSFPYFPPFSLHILLQNPFQILLLCFFLDFSFSTASFTSLTSFFLSYSVSPIHLTISPSSLLSMFQITEDFFFSFFFLIYLFLFMAVLGLRFCARAFSSCGKRGPLFMAVHGPLTAVASLVVEHGL